MEPQEHHHEHGGAQEIIVNGRALLVTDIEPSGSQILSEAGFEPVDEHVLIERMKIGSRLVSLDERVDLKGVDGPRFYAFRTGEVFTFTVNEHGFQWGRPMITEPELRDFAGVPDEDVLVQEEGDDEPRVLNHADRVELGACGTEHLRIEKRLVTVFVDNIEKQIPRGIYSAEELLVLLQVQAGYLLNLATDNGLMPLKPQQRIRVKDGMRFLTQVPGGGSSHNACGGV
jgi:multiubiquitin